MNKTPSNATAKTVLAHKRGLLAVAFGIILAGAAISAFLATRHATPPYTWAQIGGEVYSLTVPATADAASGQDAGAPAQDYALHRHADARAQQKGLGGLPSMPRDAGMLFLYHQEARRCFWMKDMHFPLDIIWLDGQKRVVHVRHNLSPDTYPEHFCAEGSQYVIELNAGEAASAGIRAGQTLTF